MPIDFGRVILDLIEDVHLSWPKKGLDEGLMIKETIAELKFTCCELMSVSGMISNVPGSPLCIGWPGAGTKEGSCARVIGMTVAMKKIRFSIF